MRALACLFAFICSLGLAPALAADPSLRLIPYPKEVVLQDGQFTFDSSLVFEVPADRAEQFNKLLHDELERRRIPRPKIQPHKDNRNEFRIAKATTALPPPSDFKQQPGEYALQATPTAIVAAAPTPAGLYYALQTLCQLIRANATDHKLPCVAIHDTASIQWRGFQDDITRGPSTKLDVLEREAVLGSFFKMNLFAYYNEYQYAFAKHPDIGPADGSLTPAELKQLVAFTKPVNVDILGSQQSFGHMSRILGNESYKNLRENGDVLTPAKEETYKFLDDLYSEVVPHLPLPFFNVCCDEVGGLGEGPAKEMVAKLGPGGVYVKHMQRIHDILKNNYGKRMMMWGDIILSHADRIKDIPKDTIMLSWGYDPRKSFVDQIDPFAKSGFEFFVCPGVNCWNRILPDFAAATINIHNFVRDGAKANCLGVLNTAWDDNAETFGAPNWYGYAWGAECSWNASSTSPDDFNRRIGAVLFGEKDDHFGQAITLLAKTHTLPGMKGMSSDRFFEIDFTASDADLATNGQKLLDIVQPALKQLKECQGQATVNADLLDWFIFGATRMELIGKRMLTHAKLIQEYQQLQKLDPTKTEAPLVGMETKLRQLAEDHSKLGRQFWELWEKENKPYARSWTMKRYKAVVKTYQDLADRIVQIRADALKNKPLPSPEDAGLIQKPEKKK